MNSNFFVINLNIFISGLMWASLKASRRRRRWENSHISGPKRMRDQDSQFGRKEPRVGDTWVSYRRHTFDYWSQCWWISAIAFPEFVYNWGTLTATASGIRLFNDYSLAIGFHTFARCICRQISILKYLISVATSRFLSQAIPYMY